MWAKIFGVKVLKFSLGFGPKLVSKQWGETEYLICAVPLGGYVKMVGEGGENDEEDTDPRSYKNKTVGQRMAIISAGVIMNIILACVLFMIVFMIGMEERLFPHVRSLDDPAQMEEERRLCYVAMTRAKERLVVMYRAPEDQAADRRVSEPSRFLKEIERGTS